jgi:hypothetical protein
MVPKIAIPRRDHLCSVNPVCAYFPHFRRFIRCSDANWDQAPVTNKILNIFAGLLDIIYEIKEWIFYDIVFLTGA